MCAGLDPNELFGYAHARLRQTRRSATSVGPDELLSVNASGVMTARREEFRMRDFMLTTTLPEVKPFTGKQSGSFERFLKTFLIKYPRTTVA